MTKKYRMFLLAMVFLVVATPTMSELKVVSPLHEEDFANEPVIHHQQNWVVAKKDKKPSSSSGTSSTSTTPTACQIPNAQAELSPEGICQIVYCNAGYSDCDGSPQNGCEKTSCN